uniref:Uncharacterized protein n=1 Tax=Anguilla anguilla TaxID=7936 RepID=A0A0E9WEH8_ANGAN
MVTKTQQCNVLTAFLSIVTVFICFMVQQRLSFERPTRMS